MQFSKEQRRAIDKLLEEGKEEQRRNGNITYTQEEIVEFFSTPKKERELYFNSLR